MSACGERNSVQSRRNMGGLASASRRQRCSLCLCEDWQSTEKQSESEKQAFMGTRTGYAPHANEHTGFLQVGDGAGNDGSCVKE